MRRCDALPGFCVLALVALLAGCGGGTHNPGVGGQINIGVRFPTGGAVAPARVPTNAESVRISVLAAPTQGTAAASSDTPAAAAGTPLAPDTIINRPPGGGVAQATILGIPAGPAIVKALAHPRPDGQGPGLAEAQKTVTVRAEKTTTVALTLVEIVANVVASPTSLLMLVGEQADIAAEALDATGAAVIGASLAYSSDDASVATVDATGRVQALARGSTTIRATHAASGKQAEVSVKVVRARVVRVEVRPDRPATVVGAPVQFSARAFDDLGRHRSDAEFDWHVQSAGMGTVDATGRFTPARLGLGRVVATERVTGTEGVGRTKVAEWAVLLEWAAAVDLDLHLFDSTNHAYFGNLVVPFGELISDAISPPGAEGFAGSTASAGRFPVAVNYFRGQGDVAATATLLVPGQTPVEGQLTLTQANANGGYPVTTPTASWGRPFDVRVSRTGEVYAQPPDTSIPLGPGGARSK